MVRSAAHAYVCVESRYGFKVLTQFHGSFDIRKHALLLYTKENFRSCKSVWERAEECSIS
jgi:hypothetical protein